MSSQLVTLFLPRLPVACFRIGSGGAGRPWWSPRWCRCVGSFPARPLIQPIGRYHLRYLACMAICCLLVGVGPVPMADGGAGVGAALTAVAVTAGSPTMTSAST